MALSPYFWLGLLVVLLTTFGTGYYTGSKHTRNSIEADQLHAQLEAEDAAEEQAEKDNVTAQVFEKEREVIRTVYIKVKERVDENIDKNTGYSECGLDDDGLRIYNENPRNKTDSTGKFNPAMP
ncbi:MAG: hypothetical protein K2Q13_04075 [Nitrosomonas sp.]|uniref:hypothetical protein n=1 Tax=Nitrosomonas sp. TaxID=42353 RepID=UPI0025FB324C|nr:hypothetical protein [Nitrosomonas sp.]MBY0474225.1 hypothetical protein [Nitrosomonas sp.]